MFVFYCFQRFGYGACVAMADGGVGMS